MKSEIAMALTTLFLFLGDLCHYSPVINQDSEEAMMKSKAMIIEGSQLQSLTKS